MALGSSITAMLTTTTTKNHDKNSWCKPSVSTTPSLLALAEHPMLASGDGILWVEDLAERCKTGRRLLLLLASPSSSWSSSKLGKQRRSTFKEKDATTAVAEVVVSNEKHSWRSSHASSPIQCRRGCGEPGVCSSKKLLLLSHSLDC